MIQLLSTSPYFLQRKGGTQLRAKISPSTVKAYTAVYARLRKGDAEQSATPFPPLVVFYDGINYWLADGFHRLKAARRAGYETIECEVRSGTQRDAILYAVGANHTHGLRRTNADKRLAVRALLDDAEWGGQSDRWIANVAGVSHEFVRKLRQEAVDGGGATTAARKRTGIDLSTIEDAIPYLADRLCGAKLIDAENRDVAIAKLQQAVYEWPARQALLS